MSHRNRQPDAESVKHGPAETRLVITEQNAVSLDNVICIRCLAWPPQAADWPTRHRNYGWPDTVTVECVVSNGCDVVQVAHRLCRQDEWMNMYQRRLSFSRAEIESEWNYSAYT